MTTILAASTSKSSPVGLLFPVLLLVGFYLIAIRPNRRRAQAVQSVRSQLAPGREVVTSAGLYATVVDVDPDSDVVVLEIAPGVRARFARAAIVRLVDEPVPMDDAPTDTEES